MIAPLWPALALVAAPVQAQQSPPPSSSSELADPLTDPAARQAARPPAPSTATPQQGSTAAELADPLADPAQATPATATVVAPRHAAGDPLEHFNRRMFAAHEKFDRRFLRPAALGYKHALPKPMRDGIRNFFSNLGEPIVFLNYLLQLKPGKAIETAARFAFNSSLGIGGLIDIAKTPPIHLKHRPNSLGDTLGYYGIKPGPYLFLPFVGPTTLRDLVGGQADGLVLPLAVGAPFDRLEYQIPRAVLTGLDQRAEADQDLQTLYSTAVDPYATLRSVYLQDRAGEIAALHGHRHAAPAAPELGEPLADPANTGPKPGAAPPSELNDPLTDPAAPAQPVPAPAPAAPARK